MNVAAVNLIKPGRIRYSVALDLQKSLVGYSRIVKPPKVGSLVLCEHDPPVYTFGLRDTEQYEKWRHQLSDTGAEVFKIRRGGLVTFHGPGQLVCYPVLNLRLLKVGVKEYINKLEQAVIDVCNEMGVADTQKSCNPGVWVGNNKICAVGVQVTNGVSWHGIALNCSTDLSWFDKIVPCGLVDKGTTSLTEELGKTVSVETVEPILMTSLERTFNICFF